MLRESCAAPHRLLLALKGSASEHGVRGGDEHLARLLIARGADLQAQDKQGWSPLLMPPLISRGADVNAREQDGTSAMMTAAVVEGDEQSRVMMNRLIAAGANLNATDA